MTRVQSPANSGKLVRDRNCDSDNVEGVDSKALILLLVVAELNEIPTVGDRSALS